MRRLFGLLVFGAIGWSLWWVAGARLGEAGLRLWLSERRAEGWLAEAGAAPVSGYPVAFDMTVADLDLADPGTGLAWSLPGFRVIVPAWNPADVTAIWPERQVLATPDERIEIAASGMEARVRLRLDGSLALVRGEAAVRELALVSSAGWTAALAEGRLFAAEVAERPGALELRFDARRLEPSAPLLALLDPEGRLPRDVELVSLDATVGFDRPWDRRAVEERRPQPTAIDLRRLKARWGRLEIEAAGDLVVDAEGGVPEGEIQVRAVNWREMLDLGRASGLIPEGLSGTLESGLELLAAAAGNPETLEVPLGFRGGLVFLGPVPLGPAPRLALR